MEKIYIVEYCPMEYEPQWNVAIFFNEKDAIEYCLRYDDMPHKTLIITVWLVDDDGCSQLNDETIRFERFTKSVRIGERTIGTAYSSKGTQLVIMQDSSNFQQYTYPKSFNNENL